MVKQAKTVILYVYSVCSHVLLQAVFQRLCWTSRGLWGASKHLLLSAQTNAWANINTAPPPRVQSSCCPHPWPNTWDPTWKIKNDYCVICLPCLVYCGIVSSPGPDFSTSSCTSSSQPLKGKLWKQHKLLEVEHTEHISNVCCFGVVFLFQLNSFLSKICAGR